MKIYERVTRDKYELPLAVADSECELAEILGISINTVYRGIKKFRSGKKSIYREIEIGGAPKVKHKPAAMKRKSAVKKMAKPIETPNIEDRHKKDEWQKVIMCFKNI